MCEKQVKADMHDNDEEKAKRRFRAFMADEPDTDSDDPESSAPTLSHPGFPGGLNQW